jgi:hypothetical protein
VQVIYFSIHRVHRLQQGESHSTLPAIAHTAQLQSDPGGHHHENFILKPQIRKKSLPKFTFTRTELQTLACFRDDEVAEQVLEWLEMQGKLSDK